MRVCKYRNRIVSLKSWWCGDRRAYVPFDLVVPQSRSKPAVEEPVPKITGGVPIQFER